MKLHVHEVKAIVDTLEQEHEKRFGKKDSEGLTKEERTKLVEKNKRIRKEIQSLSLETRRELAIYGNGIWFDWHKNEKGVLRSEKDTLEGFPKKEKKPNLLLEGIRAIRKKYCPKITWFD